MPVEARGAAGCIEKRVGLAGGEALVQKMVGEGRVSLAEGGSEGEGLGGLGAGGAVGVEGVADDDDLDRVLADEAGDGFEVGPEIRSVQGEERPRGDAELVGDGEAYALVADV